MISVNNNEYWLKQQSDLNPNLTAVISHERIISFAELYKLSLNFAAQLKSHGIKENENIGILFNHGYEFFAAVNAVWLVGAVPALLNLKDNKEELEYKIKQAQIRYLILGEISGIHFNSELFIKNIPVIIINHNQALIDNDFSTLYAPRPPFFPQDYALILFTSGSSGKPKAAVHTFGSIYESVKATDSFSELSAKDIWLSSLPLYHIGGFMILARALISGAGCVFPHSLRHEDVEKAVQKFQPTHVSIVSITLHKFINSGFAPPENLKIAYFGGGYLDTALCKEAIGKGWPIIKVYGSSETCSMAAALHTNEFSVKPDSVGKPIGKNEIKIKTISKNMNLNNETGTNSIGEILVKSGSLFKEYFADPDLTTEKLTDGFYHTGDFGRIDSEGYLYIETRREDLIITGGENVSALEIELLIKSNENVKDVFVFGIQDKTWGQKLCAAVIADKINEEQLKTFLKNRTAAFKIPKEFYFVKEIPKTELGKVNRAFLFKQLNLG